MASLYTTWQGGANPSKLGGAEGIMDGYDHILLLGLLFGPAASHVVGDAPRCLTSMLEVAPALPPLLLLLSIVVLLAGVLLALLTPPA